MKPILTISLLIMAAVLIGDLLGSIAGHIMYHHIQLISSP